MKKNLLFRIFQPNKTYLALEKKVAMSDSRIGLDAPLVVSKIYDNALYSGFFGTLDSERIKSITERMLDSVENFDCEFIIIDLSNITLIDSAIATHLVNIGQTLKLSGIEVIICGIKGVVAQTMTVIGIQMDQFRIKKDLKSAMEELYSLSGYRLVKKD